MRLLTIDGMSAAALQIRMIKYYEEACPGFLASVDCFSGASDGGYTALFLATHVTDDHASNLAMLDEAIAFSNALVPLFHLRPCSAVRFATGWFPLLKLEAFREVLTQYLGTGTVGDLDRKIVITSYGAFDWQPYVFTNLAVSGRRTMPRQGDASTPLVDVAQATSAMPLALPLYGKGLHRLVDGGFVANNTSMLTVSEVCGAAASVDGCDPSETLCALRVLSLGSRESIAERKQILKVPGWPFRWLWKRNDWGYKQWLLRRPSLLMQMFLQGSMDLAHHEVAALIPEDRYRRIQPPMSEMDDGFRLLLGCPRRLIKSWDAEAQRLANTQPWFNRQTAWIRDHYMADDA